MTQALPHRLGRVARKVRNVAVYRRAALARPRLALRYVLRDREVTNFTYDISNVDELAAFVARGLARDPGEIRRYLEEIRGDGGFHAELARRLRAHPDRNDVPRFGRRLGWYAIVRALKPSLVVETGVHDGLGSALLLRALERNSGEGREGVLLGLDIDAQSGWLVGDDLRRRFELVIGDSARTLPEVLSGRRVGVFIHDSAHTYEHEHLELSVALEHAAPTLALVSDNAHATSALADVCRVHGIPYELFLERPLGHFYPGAGIGLGVRRG
jgi:hypothetical protein